MKPERIMLTLLLTLLFAALPLHNATAQTGLEQCNTFYHNNQFSQAIVCYQDHSGGNYSPSILFNLGNSYAQLGQIGTAILHYQRALCLAPGDSDIRGNLSLIQNEEGLFPPERSLIETIVDLCTITQWALLALAALCAYLCFAIFQLKYNQRKSVEGMVILCCITFLFIGGFGAVMKYQRWNKSVVISDSKILISPYENAARTGTVKQGRLVAVHKQHGKFAYIADETGQKGWVVQENVAQILPGPHDN